MTTTTINPGRAWGTPPPRTFACGPAHFEAAQAWRDGRAYWDGHRCYRLYAGRRVAPWSRTITRTVGGPEYLHALAEHLLGAR